MVWCLDRTKKKNQRGMVPIKTLIALGVPSLVVAILAFGVHVERDFRSAVRWERHKNITDEISKLTEIIVGRRMINGTYLQENEKPSLFEQHVAFGLILVRAHQDSMYQIAVDALCAGLERFIQNATNSTDCITDLSFAKTFHGHCDDMHAAGGVRWITNLAWETTYCLVALGSIVLTVAAFYRVCWFVSTVQDDQKTKPK